MYQFIGKFDPVDTQLEMCISDKNSQMSVMTSLMQNKVFSLK